LRVPTCTAWLVTRFVFFRDCFFVLAMAVIITFPPERTFPLP
jgi:hypothetical protein